MEPARRPSTPAEDPYHQLLSRTRDLRVEQRQAREVWFQQLELEGKDEILFELEVLLKAAACFANPRNHPGPPRRGPVVTQDFREAVGIFRDGIAHAVGLARALLGSEDRAFVFHRYLETVLPQDSARSRLARGAAEQTTPEQSLLSLRHGLSSVVEVVDGLTRSQRVPYRTFYSALALVQREVERNTFFNPLTALEFRPEFDRIRSSHVLELIRSVAGRESHRLISLAFLSLFRMLRYLRLLERIAAESSRRRRLLGRAYLTLSVLRSDARALSGYLRQHSGRLLGESFHRELVTVPAIEIRGRSSLLRASGHRYLTIRGALEGVAASVQLEMRRAFQHDLFAADADPSESEVRAALRTVIKNVRPALRGAILFLGRTLGVSLPADGVFDDATAQRETSDRLRRDVWIFAQILRAFAAKAQSSPPTDRWGAVGEFQYVREFLRYFAAMGYPVLRGSDYPRFDAFLAAMTSLSDTDLVDRTHLDHAVEECQVFFEYLQDLFERVSQREVLRGVPFDRRAAAAALRLYIVT
ncbi:MAG: hypothetical protein JW751_14780 [Polyangiaceae bacterium]|nr:hypothetical protein [Polyangiaceae bacterium]